MNNFKKRQKTNECRQLVEPLKREYPLLYEFVQPLMYYGNSRRLGPVRQASLYRIFSVCPWVTSETMPRDLGRDPERFWDLIDAATAQQEDTAPYDRETVIILYTHLEASNKLMPSFLEGKRSPRFVIGNQEFRRYLVLSYKGREHIFILRHGQMKHASTFLFLNYRNSYLRECLTDCIVHWPEAWINRRPSRLDVLHDAEKWFEGTTDNVTSWEQFNATMLDTARRHIINHYHEMDWRRVCMKFLFFFYSTLILEHKEHDFFAGSYIYNTVMVLNNNTPGHLASGFEFAVYGQKDIFRQGRGVLFVIEDADLHSSSYRKTEIKRYDLSNITIPEYWDVMANYIIHNKRNNVIYARAFLVWLINRKRELGENPRIITLEDIEEYRVFIAGKTNNGGTRNAYVMAFNHFIQWLDNSKEIAVADDAKDPMSYFFINAKTNPNPVSKNKLSLLQHALVELGEKNPRYLLDSIIVDISLLHDVRIGGLVTVSVDDITYFDDGMSRANILSKSTNPSKTIHYFSKHITDLLRKAEELTKDIREECPACTIRQQLFIYRCEKKSGLPFNAMNITRLNLDLAFACKKAGLDVITSGHLRDTFMTMLNLYMIEKGIPDYMKPSYTHHTSRRSILNYAIIDIKDILERVPELTIGKILE